jgi:hypothetical protein
MTIVDEAALRRGSNPAGARRWIAAKGAVKEVSGCF